MRCSNCGNELPNNAQFCDNCGQKVQNINSSDKSFCGNCGAELKNGVQFCGECGFAVSDGKTAGAEMNKPLKKKKRTGVVIVVCIVICIAAASAAIGYMIYSSEDDTDTVSINSSVTAKPENKEQTFPSASPSNTATPEATLPSNTEVPVSSTGGTAISSRTDLYNSALTYKRMPDIHNTVLTNDETFNALKAVIEEFDKQCADYMNEITDEVPPLLKVGTTAYNQQVEYKQKHPTLNQSYQKIDVINARQGGGYYYVWVTEVMNVNENGASKITTDHWVYKIENDNGSWYICDYTSDPAF